jgi:hypothetical protein
MFYEQGIGGWSVEGHMGIGTDYTLVLPSMASLLTVAVTHGQLWAENIKWNIPEIKNFKF